MRPIRLERFPNLCDLQVFALFVCEVLVLICQDIVLVGLICFLPCLYIVNCCPNRTSCIPQARGGRFLLNQKIEYSY